MNIGQIVDALGGWCYRSSVARELERRWYRSRLWRLVGESWNRKRVDRYRPHHLYETVISNDRMWFKLQASCWSSRQAAAFLESRFNGTLYVTADGHRPVTPFRLSDCSSHVANWESIVDRLPKEWDDGEYRIERYPYPWCETLSDNCDCHGAKGRLDATYCSDFGLHDDTDKRTSKSENVRHREYIQSMEERLTGLDESRRKERLERERRSPPRGEVIFEANPEERSGEQRGITGPPAVAIEGVSRLVARGLYCSIHESHHLYDDQAIRKTMARLTAAYAQMATLNEANRAVAMSNMGDIAAHWLQILQSEECAQRSVWGDADIPDILYKYIPKKLIGEGPPRNLRATQLLALNDDMECNVITMKSHRQEDTLAFLAMVQSKLEGHLGIAMPWEELLTRSLRYADVRLSTCIQEYLNPRVGVVSLSTDILVPTMWAHYARNTGIVVGYDSKALSALGFELRPVVYSELAPMYRPQEGDGIWLDFVNREDMERELRAGRKREGIPILVSTELAEFGAGWKSLARLLLVKGMSWAYEKEVRLLVDLEGARDIGKEDENGRPIKVIEPPPEAIREIYGGANTGDADVERAVQVARGDNKGGLFVGHLSSHAFRIQKTGGMKY